MKNQETPLGRTGLLIIPIGIALTFLLQSFWVAVGAGAVVGAVIANIRAVLFVGHLQNEMKRNPLNELQAKIQGVHSSMQIRFIFMQSVIGAAVVATWTAAVSGIAVLLR